MQAEGSVENGVYIGTDLGVFYRSGNSAEWIFFNDGLPLVMVNELEILPQFGKIRAATYGRGIWQAPLNGTILSINKLKNMEKELSLFPNPAQEETYITLPKNASVQEIRIYNIAGKCLEKIQPVNGEKQQKINTKHFPAGIYMVNLIFNEGTITKKLSVIK